MGVVGNQVILSLEQLYRYKHLPINYSETKILIGMVGYLSNVSINISDMCSFIYEVMGLKSEWYWGLFDKHPALTG